MSKLTREKQIVGTIEQDTVKKKKRVKNRIKKGKKQKKESHPFLMHIHWRDVDKVAG